jgi:hypothetical protein
LASWQARSLAASPGLLELVGSPGLLELVANSVGEMRLANLICWAAEFASGDGSGLPWERATSF